MKKKIIHIQPLNPDVQLKEDSPKNDIRLKCIETMKNLLKMNELEELEQEIYKVSLEYATTKHIIKDWNSKLFLEIYLANIRKITGNLDSSSYIKNKELIEKVKNKEISIKALCLMNYYELNSSRWKEAIERQRIIEKQQLEGNKSMATDQFLCRKCYKRECTYYEMQTRSADEPMTIFINCLSCGNNWRQ